MCINICQLSGFKFAFGYYGRFKIGPLERTWGVTLGNLLRRVLIGNINGISVRDIKFFIEGKELLKNEFLTFSTVKEPIFEIIENLKSIILIGEVENFSNFEESLIVKQELQGPCQIFAKDLSFSESFSLRNPNLYIGTIDFKEILELHLVLEPDKKSLVQKVNFKVEENPGKKISEQIFLEIWTFGEISPRSVLEKALSKILDNLEKLISNF
nr:RNA polymerase alpha subunit [Eutreptiella sp. CCMP1594]